ncbi:MAG: DUF4070 domain-containing protein [Desulfuromonadales bacterium]|jgi:radical SAM superfamily enzyme YgiQ (UPF0313 family)
MHTLLIYPEFPDTFWSFKHALKFARKRASSPPLGLLTVAALLPAEWPVRLIDLNVAPLTDADLAWADMVFIGAMNVQRQSAHQIIERCRAAGVRIVAGGPLFTGEHGQFPQVDHFVLNEAELSLPPFLTDLAAGCAGPIYRSDQFADLTATPVPRWELVERRRYAAMSVQFSRGCPWQCDFCNVTALFGRKTRTKLATQIIAELDSLYAAGWRSSIFFVDDNFIGNKQLLKNELLPRLIDWQRDKKGITFYTEVSIDLADDAELTAMMVEAGFSQVFIGIETPNEASLGESCKRQNQQRDLVADVKRLQHAGLQVQGGFIVGFDSDPLSIFQKQIDFIQNSGIVTAMVGLLQAPHGTRLYERLKREGRLLGEMSGDNANGLTNIVTRMNLETLLEGYRFLLERLYSPGPYYRRVMTFLREYRPPKIRAGLDFDYKIAFFQSIYRLGILGRERVHFWKVLLWTALHRPRLIPAAITLAIYGYHFRKVSELDRQELK